MEFISLCPGERLTATASAIAEVLTRVDHEFIPPLSSRDSTTTKDLAGGFDVERPVGPPVTYLASVLDQHAILALSAGTLVGLISFRTAHSELLLRNWSPCDYVSTVIVLPELRRRGIARGLYAALLGRTGMRSPYVATRTWSTNHSHLNLLAELGFAQVACLPDHRGPGIATVYYARTA
jgi:ribosomal protein S18 acetylase RimI-like enzyme